MEVPNWVWDELRFRTTGSTGLLIALAIFRHGGGRNAEAFPREGIKHRARVRTTLNSLAKMAGVEVPRVLVQPDDPGPYARTCLRCGLDEGLGVNRLCARCCPPAPFWAHVLRWLPCVARRWGL